MPEPFERPYLDSSVYISAIRGETAEPGRGELSAQLLDLARSGAYQVFASTFVFAEVIKDRGQPKLTLEEESLINRYLEHPSITWIEVDMPIAQHARALSREHGLKPPDAVHLASAVRAGCDQLLAWDGDFPDGTIIDGVRLYEPHVSGRPEQLPGFSQA